MKLRLRLWEAGEVSDLISWILEQQHSGPLRRRIRVMQPQTDEQRGKRACALLGLVGGVAADCRRNWTTALVPRSSGIGTHPSSAECAEAARIAWGGGRYKKARSATREQGRTRTGIASLPHVKLSPMSGPGPTGERQEHLDAIVSFAGARQATGDFPEECRFLLDTQLMFLKKEKDPTSKLLDDDDWIRSLTEAQEITADVREDSVMDHQEVDPKKVRPIQSNGKFLRKYISRRLLALTEGETAALTTAMRQLVVGSQGGGEALAIFHHLLYDE